MAFPVRLPARLKSIFRPIRVAGAALGPTGIGVLLSVGAHAGIIAAGTHGGGDRLFDAFDQAAEAEAAEEKIVPIVQLTPAERSRLPAFAQPRRDPLSTSSLSSLALPPGLPVPNASIQRRPTPVPANRMPSATARTPVTQSKPLDLSRFFATRPAPVVPPAELPQDTNIASRTPATEFIQPDPSVTVPPLGAQDNSSTSPNSGGQIDPVTGLPRLEGQSTADILARLNGISSGPAAPNQVPAEVSPGSDGGSNVPSTPEAEGEPEGVPIPIENSGANEVPALALNPADGDAAELIEDLSYSGTLTADADVAQKVDSWTEEIVAQKGSLPTGTADIDIVSAFKACRSNPPTDGLIGVVVNPDGTLENLDVLKSTGYETLNLRALQAVENYDFGQINEPTEVQVSVGVSYDAAGCVDVEGLKQRLNDD